MAPRTPPGEETPQERHDARNAALTGGVSAVVIGALRSVADSWMNALTGLGGARDRVAATEIALNYPRLTDPQLTAMYSNEDLSAKLVDVYPREAMRLGFEIGGLADSRKEETTQKEEPPPAFTAPEGDSDTEPGTPPEIGQENERLVPFQRKRQDAKGKKEVTPETEVMNFLKPWHLIAKVTEAAIWGRLYGGAAIYLADGKAALYDRSKPWVEGDKVAYLRVLDRRFLSPSGQGPDDLDEQGRPLWYDITNSEGRPMIPKVHRSRFVWFRGARTDEQTRIQLNGWDLSVLQRALNALRNDGVFWGSVMQLMTEASVGVTKIKGLYSMIAGKQKERLQERIQLNALARSISKSMVLDADGEDYTRVQTTFAGVSDLNGASVERVAASGEMPVTVLFGRAPAGLNATGDSDLRWFFARVQAYREHELADAILTLVRLLLAMPSAPRGIDLDCLEIRWPNLWAPSASEQAEIYTKTAQGDQTYRDMGVLMTEEIALSRFADDGFSQETEIDRSLRELALEAVTDPMAGAQPPMQDPNALPPGELDPNADPNAAPPTLGTEETRDEEEGAEDTDTEENGDAEPGSQVKPAIPGSAAPGGAPAPPVGAASSGVAPPRPVLGMAGGVPGVPAGPIGSGPAQKAEGGGIQQQALNGTQVTSMIEIVGQVARKEISRESGLAALEIAFQLSTVDAERLLGPIDFQPEPPEPEFGFGGGGGFGGPPGKGAPPFGEGDKGGDGAEEKGAPPGKGGPPAPFPPKSKGGSEGEDPKDPRRADEFDPDQPRDENGMWAGGGGTLTTKIEKRAGKPRTKASIKRGAKGRGAALAAHAGGKNARAERQRSALGRERREAESALQRAQRSEDSPKLVQAGLAKPRDVEISELKSQLAANSRGERVGRDRGTREGKARARLERAREALTGLERLGPTQGEDPEEYGGLGSQGWHQYTQENERRIRRARAVVRVHTREVARVKGR